MSGASPSEVTGAPADGTSSRVTIRPGLALHVVRWPSGPIAAGPPPAPVVCVHGLASNARLWDGVARRLAAMGHDVVAVDQRGHGRSDKPDDGYDMVTVADDLAQLIGVLELDRPLVVGQSWGGNVVLELAAQRPDLVRAIACIDGGFIDLAERFASWEDAAAALAPPQLIGTPVDRIRSWLDSSAADWPEEGRLGTLANFEIRDDGTVAPWLTFDRHLSVLQGLWDHRPSTRYPSVTVPTLMIPADTGTAGWDDKPAAVDAAVAALPDGRAVWFRPAHHDVHAQQPDAVAELLHAFAQEQTAAP